MASLLIRCGAEPTVAPSLREVPLESNSLAVELARDIAAGRYRGALLILLTGVGTRLFLEAAVTAVDRTALVAALNELTVLVRGPKPVPVLKEWGVRIDHRAPEPNTWREVVSTLECAQTPLSGRQVLVQEYGQSTPDLYAWLELQGAQVTPIPVYRWELPEDRGPLESAIRRTVQGEFDILMFTSAEQVRNVLRVAAELDCEPELRAAMSRCLLASIGPTTTETLLAEGLPQPFEPSHGKMGHLVTEACAYARRES